MRYYMLAKEVKVSDIKNFEANLILKCQILIS